MHLDIYPTIPFDSTFGTSETVQTIIKNDDYAYNAIVLDNDKILVVGYSNFEGIALKYNNNGILDKTFGSSGVLNINVGSTTFINNLKKQFDNKFLVGGTTRIDDRKKNDASFVSRFTPEGVIDQSFGTNGTVITEYGAAGDNTVDLFVQSDQKIVGLFRIRSNSFAIERFLPIGQLDLNFGLDGKNDY